MASASKFISHDQYFDSVQPDVRTILYRIQKTVASVVPGSVRCISYNMPAFKARKVFFYFSAFKSHIGVYPPVTSDKALIRELAPYRGDKGNLKFPLNQPLPFELIGRVAKALSKQYAIK